MIRVTRGKVGISARNKLLKQAKGFYGRSKNSYRIAVPSVYRALKYAYRDRKQNRRNLQSMWIQQLNRSVFYSNNLNYSLLKESLNKSGIVLNKQLLNSLILDSSKNIFFLKLLKIFLIRYYFLNSLIKMPSYSLEHYYYLVNYFSKYGIINKKNLLVNNFPYFVINTDKKWVFKHLNN